ncbi:MAG: hypothetical protein JST87_16335 [Bacteroidetes bacterium]|nr:hypothetical protein [Bacteroidota bacterium]
MIIKESPLQGISIGNAATVAIRELPGLHSTDIRVTPGTAAQAAISAVLGLDLPGKQGELVQNPVSGGEQVYALHLSPDWWLIVGYEGAWKKLAPLKDEHHFSAVDVSGQRTTFELEGPKVREVLAHLWEQDLREKSFPVASVSQGLMAKAPVILCHIAPFRYRIMVRSSFALHFWKALADAAEEYL